MIKEPLSKLFQFRDSYMATKFCFKTRIGKDTYEYKNNGLIKEFGGQKKSTGIPICESHLHFSQEVPSQDVKTGTWKVSKNKIWTLLIIVDIILVILAEELPGVSFFFMPDILINNIFDALVTIFHFFIYGPWYALIDAVELLDVIPVGWFFLIEFVAPIHWIPTIANIFVRRSIQKKSTEVRTLVKNKLGERISDLTYLQFLYPEPLVDWTKKGIANYKDPWNKITESGEIITQERSKSITSITQITSPQKISVTASKLNKKKVGKKRCNSNSVYCNYNA